MFQDFEEEKRLNNNEFKNNNTVVVPECFPSLLGRRGTWAKPVGRAIRTGESRKGKKVGKGMMPEIHLK